MSGVLCLLEVRGGVPLTSPDELRAAALVVADGGPVVVGLLGTGGASAAKSLIDRFDRVLVADENALETYTVESATAVAGAFLEAVAPSSCIAAHTLTTREWMPLLAYTRGGGLVMDCLGLASEGNTIVATRPVFGGAALGEFAIHAEPAFATIHAKSFVAEAVPTSPPGTIEAVSVSLPADAGKEVLEEVHNPTADGIRLQDARVVVSGGRGIGGPSNWHFIEETAAALGAAVGCSRPLVDSGWFPPSMQVGLTGVSVSPRLYLAVGISGASQHISGISGAECVVAINTDPGAPIFKAARLGVVGDFRQVLPAFIARVRELS
jgi:electron transfer flavoprotein alpha subunit